MDKFVLFWKVASWIATAVAALVALAQYRRNSTDARAKTMQELMREFQDDHAEAFYTFVERKDDDFYRSPLTFDSTESERKIDAMLLFLENILHLHEKKTISDGEFVHFKYYLMRVITDPDLSKYLHDFKEECAKKKTVNPFVHILDYCRTHGAFEATNESSSFDKREEPGTNDENKKAATEEVFDDYLIRHYHGMTRTARAVKSRVVNYFLKVGLSYKNPPSRKEMDEEMLRVSAKITNADVAASVRSALRQYYRASFGVEPNA